MTSNQKYKAIILSINLDFLLKNRNKGMSRCARNIIELGISLVPRDNIKLQKDILYNNLMTILETTKTDEVIQTVKEWFSKTFFN